MLSALLLRTDRADRGSGISRFIERLESRCLLSAVAPAIPVSVVGPTFTGSANLTFESTPTLPTHSGTVPIQLSFSSVSGNTLSGTETGVGVGPSIFTAVVSGESFNGVFADGSGTIAGTFTGNAGLSGTLSQTVGGQLASGSYSVAIPGTPGTVLNFFALGTGSAGPTTSSALATPAPTATSTAPSSGLTPAPSGSAASQFLVSGASTSDLNVNGTITGDNVVPGLAPNLLLFTSTLSVFAPPALGLFSNSGPTLNTSSAFISIGNSGSTSLTIGDVLAIGPVGG